MGVGWYEVEGWEAGEEEVGDVGDMGEVVLTYICRGYSRFPLGSSVSVVWTDRNTLSTLRPGRVFVLTELRPGQVHPMSLCVDT